MKCLNNVPYNGFWPRPRCNEVFVDEDNIATTDTMIDAEFFFDKYLLGFKVLAELQNIGFVVEEYGVTNEPLYRLCHDDFLKWYVEMIRVANENGITICAGWSHMIGDEPDGTIPVSWTYMALFRRDEHGNYKPHDLTGTNIVKVPGTYGIWLDMNMADLLWGNIDQYR